ncbi:MAG TPA: plastocyanin/azurin family copper-binding protein [Acidimicrobiia bacterium]|nr:plastocyanin/azurin family copper-binding protein [Acidimicrobiia bacterium]
MGRRRFAIAALALALVTGACSGDKKEASEGTVLEEDVEAPSPVGPQTYTVEVDLASPEGKNLQAAAFFPLNVAVRPGDTIVFENRSAQALHTVTFTPGKEKAPAYAPVTKTGQANPLIFEPCYTANVPPDGAESCPDQAPATPPSYSGAGLWSSGALAPATAPDSASRSVRLTLAAEIPAGTYSYGCLLHPNMSGIIEVVESDDLRRSVPEMERRTRNHRQAVLDSAAEIADPAAPVAGQPVVTSGWGTPTVAVNRFSPSSLRVPVGQTVTWKGASPFEPHTVTFDSPFQTAQDAGVFTPAGAKAGSRYAGGYAHSGLIGPAPFSTDSFSLVFTKPGTYSYVCVLHPGMAGEIVVTG